MNINEFSNLLRDFTKSEKETFKDFLITEASTNGSQNIITPGVEARAKDLKLDQIVEIQQELSDGTIKKFKFKIIEIWPAPTNFFTVVSLEKPKDELNYWTLFFDRNLVYKKGIKIIDKCTC